MTIPSSLPLLDPAEEERLLSRASIDPAAFELLYRAYVKPVYRYLYYRVGTKMDAEDLTTQVFMQVMKSIKTYRHEGHFQSWLFTIARHRATDFFRRQRSLVSMEYVEDLLPGRTHPHIESEQADQLRLLAAQVQKLNEEEQEMLRLRFAACMSFAEMSRLLGGSEDAVKKRFYRLIEKMQQTAKGEQHERA